MRFKDKVAIVTGGTSGIGLACAETFIKEGASVVISSNQDNSEEIANGLGDKCKFVFCDVSKEDDVINLVNKTVELFGKLDIMVANAGIGDGALVGDESFDVWNKIVSINLSGVFLCNKYAINQMLKNGGGSIVNTSSILGLVGNPIAPAYCSCKSGIINLTRSGALGYATKNIRINAVSPGFIRTAIIKDIDESTLVPLHPIGRIGEAGEVAAAIAFLASDEASFITGATLPVDGGYTAQ